MSAEYNCPSCDFATDSEHGLQVHCGREHSIEDNPYRILCECNYCGDEFSIRKSNHGQGSGKHCSKDCYAEHQKDKNRVERECKYCGDTFRVTKSRVEGGEGVVCSRKCADKHKTMVANVHCTCEHCGDEFTVKKSIYEQQSAKYCSNKCQGLSMRKTNPDIRNSYAYIKWRENVLERDNYKCQDCGTEDNLHAHHIVPLSENDDLATDESNGVTVCVDCHQIRHEKRGDVRAANLLESQ